MKKIIFIGFLFCGFIANAQTDSIRAMIDKDIRNSAINAFTNLRLNYILKAIANQIDTVSLHTGSTINLTKTLAGTSMTIFPSGGGAAVVIDSANSIRAGLLTIASWRFLDSLHRGLISLGALTDTVPISTRISTVQNSKLDTIISVNDSVVLFKINGRSSSLLIRGNASSVSGSNNFTTGYTYDGHTLTSPRNGTTAITAVIPLNDSLAAVRNVKVDSAWGKNDSTVTISINGRTRDIAFKGAPYNVKVDPTFFSVLTDGTLTYVGPTGGSVTVDPTPTVGSTVNPPSSNGTAVALNNKNENLNAVNVLQHGVVTNSGTDQSAAIAAIIAAGYRKLYFPLGDYWIKSLLTFSSIAGLEFYGDGDATRFYSANIKQMFFFNGSTQNLYEHDFSIESRVSDATDDPSGEQYFYDNGASGHINNIRIERVSFKIPLAKTNALKFVSEGTASLMENVNINNCTFDSIGRMAVEFQNHLDRTVSRYKNCNVTNSHFKDIGTIHATPLVFAISLSGKSNNSEASGNTIQDVHEAAGFSGNGGIENAGDSGFVSDHNTFLSVNHGFVCFAGTDTGHLTDGWKARFNTGIVHSHIDKNNARAFVLNHVNGGDFSNNNIISDSYFIYYNNASNNTGANNIGKTTDEEVVVELEGNSVNNTLTGGSLSDSGSVCCNLVIRALGSGATGNHFPGIKLIQSDGTRGDMGNSSGATNNDTYTRQDGKVFGNYNGSTPEGNVVSEVGGTMTNNAGVIYTKTSGSGNTGWAVLATGGLSSLGYGLTGSTSVPKVDTTTIDLRYPKVFNVKLYGAVGDGVTNDGPAIRRTVIAAGARPGLGVVYFPNGTYVDSDPIDSTYNGYDCNCQIPIPIDSLTTTRSRIIFRGETAPNYSILGATTGARIQPSGVTIYSKYAGTRASRIPGTAIIGSNGPNLGGVGNGENLNYLSVENINFVVKNNPNGAGPEIGGVNGRHIASVDVRRCTYSIDTTGGYSTSPLRMISAFETSDCDNEIGNALYDNLAIGARYGYIVGEHTSGDQLNAFLCYTGVAGKWGNHASSLGKILVQWCTNALGYVDQGSACQATPLCALNIDLIDVEGPGACFTGKWYNQAYFLNDSLNRLTGNVRYWVTNCGTGGNGNASWTANGGSNIKQLALGTNPSGGSSLWLPGASSDIYYIGKVGIGATSLTPTADLDVHADKNSATQVKVKNANTGTGAYAEFIAMNGDSANVQFGILGKNHSGGESTGFFGVANGISGDSVGLNIYDYLKPITFSIDGTATTALSIISNTKIKAAGLASGATSPTQSGTIHNLTIDANGLIGHALPSGGGGGTVSAPLDLGGYYTSGFGLRQGDITLGSADINNSYLGHNIEDVSGTGYVYRTTHSADLLQFFNGGGFYFATAPSGTAGTVATFAPTLTGNGSNQVKIGNAANYYAGLNLPASTTSSASLNMPSGTAKTSPNDGDMWYDGTHLYFRNSSTNKDLFASGGGGSSSLTSTYLGYGDVSNLLTGTADLNYDHANAVLKILGPTTGSLSGSFYYDGPDPANAAYLATGIRSSGGYFGTTSNSAVISSSANGTGTQLPIDIGGYNSGWQSWLKLSTAGIPTFAQMGGTGNRLPVLSSGGVMSRSTYDPALFAPLASPTFTGTPAAPTQSIYDNSTALATTAYTDRAAGTINSVIAANTTATLTQAHFLMVNINPPSGTITYTATFPASPNTGDIVRFIAGGSIAVGTAVVSSFTLNANTGQTKYGASTPTSLVGGDVIEYQYSGISNNTWYRTK